MLQTLNEPVSVISIYNHARKKTLPVKIYWGGQVHEIEKLGLWHTFKKGATLYHVFSVNSKKLFFKLTLNSDNLTWRLEQVSDGQPE